jgi:hypothetical protein
MHFIELLAQRRRFGTQRQTIFVLRRERPHLADTKRPSALRLQLRPHLALTQRIAIALVVVGVGTGSEEVGFIVATVGDCRCLAFSKQCDA